MDDYVEAVTAAYQMEGPDPVFGTFSDGELRCMARSTIETLGLGRIESNHSPEDILDLEGLDVVVAAQDLVEDVTSAEAERIVDALVDCADLVDRVRTGMIEAVLAEGGPQDETECVIASLDEGYFRDHLAYDITPGWKVDESETVLIERLDRDCGHLVTGENEPGPTPALGDDLLTPSVQSGILRELRAEMQRSGITNLDCTGVQLRYDVGGTSCAVDQGAVEIVIPSSGSPTWTLISADFATPSGNIRCSLNPAEVACQIRGFDFAVPDNIAACADEWGVFVRVRGTGPGPLDCIETELSVGDRILSYDESVTVGDYTCASSPEGLACHDRAGVGFMLSRAAFEPSA